MPGQVPPLTPSGLPLIPVPAPAALAATRSAYSALACLDPRLPVPLARRALLRRLAEVTRADHVQLWFPAPDGSGSLRSVMCWPPDAAPIEDLDPAQFPHRPDLRSHALLADDGRVHTAITLTSGRPAGGRRRRELDDTANCLMVLHRREELQTEVRHQVGYTAQLAGEVLDSARRLAGVRELERRRVAAEVVSFSRGRLTPLQTGIDRWSGQPDLIGRLGELRAQLDRLVADFRSLVRGIHPQVLYRHGLRAALAEVAAAHPGRVRITGSVPARVDHEVAAALYYLSAAAVHALARSRTDLEITLEHRILVTRAAGLQVTLEAPAAPVGSGPAAKAEMRAALAVDADRLGTIGGWVEVDGEADRIRVTAWVPDRLEPVARAALLARGNLHARVRAQALGLVARYGEGPGSARARRLLSRMDEPVHVAVIGLEETTRRAERITETVRTRPDLVLTPVIPGSGVTPAHGAPSLRGDLSIGIIDTVADVIVRPSPGAPEKSFDVVLPGAGVLLAGADWRDLPQVLTTEVVARADLLRARTALGTMLRLARLTPPPAERLGSLEQDLEELRLGAGELADLESQASAL
ncbi:hypothetical protein [Kineosporia sp. NBRC 101731]|uniref:hypothetical protein n=1 Tax=Kineosporia sp. NBRC 101731 TaxID=3032199 RepID=UPI0024A0888F|nr:hypothetical protein [Kineosporia sp. NBRC 101731]GLY31390.1 hypothetical protein Kisp02_47550 [Kineosporia sp. NBRC 101731]